MTKQQALIPERNEELSKIKSIDDYVDYLKKHNRHTLKISLLNEQTDEEEWVGKSITFCNEDNAISHLALCSKFLELLCEEDNTNCKNNFRKKVNSFCITKLDGDLNTFLNFELKCSLNSNDKLFSKIKSFLFSRISGLVKFLFVFL